MKLLRVGIVVDNYKVDRFKKELTKAGYEFETFPFSDDVTQIHVMAPADKMDDVRKLCQKVEYHFKRSN